MGAELIQTQFAHALRLLTLQARPQLERLCRYITRPLINAENLRVQPDGLVALTLKSAWKDGTTGFQLWTLSICSPASSARCRRLGGTWGADLETCEKCGGPMCWVEVADNPGDALRLMAKFGLAPRPPPAPVPTPPGDSQLTFNFAS